MSLRAVKLWPSAVFAWSIAAGAPVIAGPLIYELPEETAAFKPGPGVETAQAYCSACHSADYVTIQPRGKGKDPGMDEWLKKQKEIEEQMRKEMEEQMKKK